MDLFPKKLIGDVGVDNALIALMAGFVEAAKIRSRWNPGNQWRTGEPLHLLLAGYTGARNTGADIRVAEIVRQFRHLLGDEHLNLSVLSFDLENTRGYFPTAHQVLVPRVFPQFLFDTMHQYHGAIACEGSMFKSTFATALTTMMMGTLGLSIAEGKLAVAYGGEAGAMHEKLQWFIQRYIQDALVLTRNAPSVERLAELGIDSTMGTDTAWTFEPAPPSVGKAILKDQGWDGKMPILAICPINPFWWPVKPSVGKALRMKAEDKLSGKPGGLSESHYASIYFHQDGEEVEQRQNQYITAISNGVKRFLEGKKIFPILVGMEKIDRKACAGLRDSLQLDCPIFVSDEWDKYEMVSVLRQSSMLLSSRYHAIVTTMGALVPSAGMTMDERIRILMDERKQSSLCLDVNDPQLENKVFDVLVRLDDERGEIQEGIRDCVEAELVRMGQMGMRFVDYVRQQCPGLPILDRFGSHGEPLDHLPAFSTLPG